MPDYYPIMLDVRGKDALVVGGDSVAAQKAAALRACGARVTVLSPQFCPELEKMRHRDELMLRQKVYEVGDLKDAFVVVAATNDPALIEAISTEARQRGQLLNIVDVPEYCNFIVPSILRRDKLTIAVSTAGTSPSLAKRIRQQLEKDFPPAYGPYLHLAAVARAHMRAQGLSYQQRDDFFGEFFASQVLELLVGDNHQQAHALTAELLQRYNVPVSTATISTDVQARYASEENHDAI